MNEAEQKAYKNIKEIIDIYAESDGWYRATDCIGDIILEIRRAENGTTTQLD